MAKNYSGKLDIDVSGFNKALKEAKANLALAASEFKLAKEQGSIFESVSDKLSRKLEALNKVYNESNNKTELLKKKYELLKNELGDTNAKVINAKKAWIDSKIETERLSNEIVRYNKALEENKDLTDNCSTGNENLCNSLTMIQQATLDVVEAIAEKACKALIDFTKETVNAGIQFETAFAGVKKVVSGTEEDFAGLQTEIRKTATEKPISADTIASLYQAGAQLGIQKDNLKEFTNAIIDLQNTSDLTAEAGATMIAQYANVMKLPSEDYERFASTLSYLGSTTATTESRIMEMAQRISGAGSSIGMTHQGVLALATALGSVGIEAEMGGSAISTIMLNIEKAVAKSSDQLHVWADTAGMTAQEFSNLWKKDVTGAIQAVLKGLSDEKAGGESLILTLEELGIKNIRQTQTMLQLSSASDMLTETIDKANKEWQNNTFLAESSNKVYETTANQMLLLQNSFKEVQLSIYDNLSEPLQEVTKELTEFLKSDEVKKFSQDFANALADLGKKASSVIKGIISNFDKICVTIKAIIPILAGIVTRFLALKAIKFASGIITNIKSLITALIQVTTAQTGFNMAMIANPIGAVATAIGLLITALMGLNALLGDTTSSYEKETNKIKEETKALEDEKQALIDNKKTRDENIAGIDAEYNHTKDLIDELKTLVDENGNVKTGYEDRINEIIPLLQNATGEEITLINNQIQGYDDLILKLDEVIAKKRAEARINAYQNDYQEAIKGLDKNKKELTEIEKNYNEVLEKKKELEESGKATTTKRSQDLRWQEESKEYKELKKQEDELLRQKELIANNDKEYKQVMDEYEQLTKDYYTTYTPKKTTTQPQGSSSTTPIKSTKTNAVVNTTKKEKEKTESDLIKEGNYTYSELNELNKKYKNDLKVYAEEMKKGNSAVTVAMVEETKKNLDTVENKLKSLKEILGTTPTNVLSTENDNTEEELENKKKILKDTLSKLGTEMKNGNTAITQEMLDQINKTIDQTDSKLQSLKNKYDKLDEDEEISEEINVGENENITSKGIIYGAGVLDEKAIEDNATKMAQMEAEAYRQAEIALQEEQLLANANQDALNKQIATLDPSNIAIYDTTNRLLAEQEQISHSQGLNDNSYRVVDAELSTLNQAKQMALTVDFTAIGLYICQSIANGINANRGLVINAVRSMMEEANSAAEESEEEESPSKVFKRIGQYMDEGLEIGIKNNSDGVIKNVKEMMANANEVAKTNISGLGQNVSSIIKSSKNGANMNGMSKNTPNIINYNFTQNNTSNKSLDTLAIYKESKSLLKREIRNYYV